MDRIIGVTIGIALVCLLLSILASHLQEIIASYSAQRATTLKTAVQNILSDAYLTRQFFTHPIIQSISLSRPQMLFNANDKKSSSGPAYISAESFRKVLQFILTEKYAPSAQGIGELIQNMPDNALQRSLVTITLGAIDEPSRAAAIERWYNATMDRVGGLYKRNTQKILLLIGLALAITFNANLFHIANVLWNSPVARDQANALASQYACKSLPCSFTDAPVGLSSAQQQLNQLPLGWSSSDRATVLAVLDIRNHANATSILRGLPRHAMLLFALLLGWGVTAIAVSLGAPFWFDLLNQVINLRSTGIKPTMVSSSTQSNNSSQSQPQTTS